MKPDIIPKLRTDIFRPFTIALLWIAPVVLTAQICDTLSNVLPTDTANLYVAQGGGYLSGHNSFGDISKADRFIFINPGQVTGAFLSFGVAEFGDTNSFVTAAVWDNDGAGGSPGTILASEDILITSIAQDVANSEFTLVEFNSPANVGDTFYLGITFTYAMGDTVALVTTSSNTLRSNTAWEQWSDSTWNDYDISWGVSLSHYIFAMVDCPINPCPSISTSTQITNTTSCGACNGNIEIFPAGGDAPYSFTWSTSDTSALLNNLCAGTYAFTVLDANGCSTTGASAVNSDSSDLTIATASTDIDCNDTLGTITVTMSGGAPPFIYDWFDGTRDTTANTTLSHNYDSAGVKIVSVTDSLHCFQSAVDTVSDLNPKIALAQSVRPVCTAENGKLKITVNSGASPFSFVWSNGATADSIENLTAGTYSVTITDSSGCVDADTFMLTQANVGSGFYVFMNSTPPNCGSTGAITTTIYGGTPPHTYIWNTGDTTQSLNNLGAGNYAITVTDSNGCQRTGAKTLQSTCSNVITGLIFEDTDGDCIPDTNESVLSNITVVATNATGDTYYGFTNSSGEFTVLAASPGTFTLAIYSWAGINCESFHVCDKIEPIYFPSLGDTSIDNYLTYLTTTGHDLSVHPGWNQANPGFQKHYWILYSNEVQTPYTGQADISFVYDSALVYSYSTPLPDVHDTAARALTWYINNVPQYISFSTAIDIYFQVPVNIPGSHLIESHFYIEPSEGDCDKSDNYFFTEQPVFGSMDPNEKEVSPAGDIYETDSLLTYTIHFQNTGNDTTHFVILKDTLSPHVNPATVQTRASSHPYSEFSVSENGVLTWFFNPIHLVDSMTNEEESKGFVSFSVKKRNNAAIGTVIENKAGIYFDYNAPIITNTVQSTVSEPDFIFTPPHENAITVHAFPNPFSDKTTIVVKGLNESYDFSLHDVAGKLSRKITSIETNQLELKREGLAPGIYFYTIYSKRKFIVAGKLIVQ